VIFDLQADKGLGESLGVRTAEGGDRRGKFAGRGSGYSPLIPVKNRFNLITQKGNENPRRKAVENEQVPVWGKHY